MPCALFVDRALFMRSIPADTLGFQSTMSLCGMLGSRDCAIVRSTVTWAHRVHLTCEQQKTCSEHTYSQRALTFLTYSDHCQSVQLLASLLSQLSTRVEVVLGLLKSLFLRQSKIHNFFYYCTTLEKAVNVANCANWREQQCSLSIVPSLWSRVPETDWLTLNSQCTKHHVLRLDLMHLKEC